MFSLRLQVGGALVVCNESSKANLTAAECLVGLVVAVVVGFF